MRTYIIAEIGPNHNGSVERAIDMINQLSEVGVDAVKFQLSIPENSYSLDSFKVKYQKEKDDSESPIEMSRKYQLSFEDHKKLYECCTKNKVDYLCSAFDIESLKYIDNEFDLRFFKIPSGEIFSLDMINYMSKRNKPIILSTGMATYNDIEVAINLLNENYKKDITILHCITDYPTPIKNINLNNMIEIKERFNYKVGFSDHSLGNDCAIAASALGADIIEKHVTIDRTLPGPDHKASATIKQFGKLVNSIRNVNKAKGSRKRIFSKSEIENRKSVRKSIVAKKNIKKGRVLSESDICYKRPGTGFLPIEKNLLFGRKIKNNINKNRIIKKDDIV